MATNVALDAALDAAFARLETLAANATSNDLAYLGHYLKNAGPGSLLAQLILAGDVQIDAIDAAAAAKIAELNLAGGAIKPLSRPIIFGSLMRNSGLGDNTTTGLGQLHTNGAAGFKLLTGQHGDATEEKWRMPPDLRFVLGDSWHYSDSRTTHTEDYNASYPDAALAMFFLKNTTNADITRNIGRIYSAGWDATAYGGAAISVGVPNNTNANRQSISAVTWTTIHSKTAVTTNESHVDAITIPANKTICVVAYASATQIADNYSYRTYGLKLALTGIGAAVGGGIEFDTEITVRAQQISCSSEADVWRA